jgi:hypothetical protein
MRGLMRLSAARDPMYPAEGWPVRLSSFDQRLTRGA